MSLRFTILGFLSIRPMSGYDLKRTFDRSVRHFWSADQAAIYRMLAELEHDALVAHERVAQDTRPDRKVFRATATGLTQLDEWLQKPTAAAPRREPLLVKLFFAGRLEPMAIHALIRAELDAVESELGDLATYVAGMEALASTSDGDPDTQRAILGPLLTLTNGARLGMAYREWLRTLERMVQDKTLSVASLLDDLRAQLEGAR